jgi:hypothetical protein
MNQLTKWFVGSSVGLALLNSSSFAVADELTPGLGKCNR